MKNDNKKKTFVTLFERTNNEILMKDVGLIPYFMMRDFEYNAYVATCKMPGEYSYLNSYLNGFKVDFFKPIFKNYWLGAVYYLIKNSKKIDILNIYHLKLQTYVLYWIYSHLNKKGKTYLKLDMAPDAIEKKDKKLQELVYKKFLKSVDYCTTESTDMQDKIYQKYGAKISILFNGYFDFDEDTEQEKEDIFLTVGRLGTTQKATDILLEAFKRTSMNHKWKLVLIGGVEDSFKPYIDEYFKMNPELRDRVIFIGKIIDKKVLKQYYEKAKVFILPSRWESFGLVLLEAMYSGCYLVGTDKIPPMNDLINGGEFGTIVKSDSINELSETLLGLTNKRFSSEYSFSIKKYARDKFSWGIGCLSILRGLKEVE